MKPSVLFQVSTSGLLVLDEAARDQSLAAYMRGPFECIRLATRVYTTPAAMSRDGGATEQAVDERDTSKLHVRGEARANDATKAIDTHQVASLPLWDGTVARC